MWRGRHLQKVFAKRPATVVNTPYLSAVIDPLCELFGRTRARGAHA